MNPLQNSSAILTEILTEICIDFDRLWSVGKSVVEIFFLTDRSKYCDRYFNRLTSVKIKFWPMFLTETPVKKKLRPHFWPKKVVKIRGLTDFDRLVGQNYSTEDVGKTTNPKFWPTSVKISVKISQLWPKFDQNSWNLTEFSVKFRSRLYILTDISVKILNFDRLIEILTEFRSKFRSKNCRLLVKKIDIWTNYLQTFVTTMLNPLKYLLWLQKQNLYN